MNIVSLLVFSYGKAFFYSPGVIITGLFVINLIQGISTGHEIAVSLDHFLATGIFSFMGVDGETLFNRFMFFVVMIGSLLALFDFYEFIRSKYSKYSANQNVAGSRV